MLTQLSETEPFTIRELCIFYRHFVYTYVDIRTYPCRCMQKVFKDAFKKAKINKEVGIDGLRYSFATGPTHRHLHESTAAILTL